MLLCNSKIFLNMSDTKIFSLGDNGFGGGGMAPLIASLCQNRGLDPNMVAAMMNNNRGYGDGFGNSAWWIIILLIFGWGGFGNGFGGGFGGRGSAQGLADLGALVNNDAGRELIMSAIQGNATAISQLAAQTHCDQNALMGSIQNLSTQICQLGNTVGLGQRDIIQQIMLGNQSLASQLCNCCCDLKSQLADFKGDLALQMCQQTNTFQNAINNVAVGQERGFSSVAYETQRQTCDITKAIADSAAQILAGQKAAEFREIQREVNQLRDERTQYQMSALLQQQSQNLINTIRPCPSPAYITCNPWGCNGQFVGNGYPYAGNCGC